MNECIICGKSFEPYYSKPNQCTCSKECRRQYQRNYHHEHWQARTEQEILNDKRRIRKYYNGSCKCRICGKPIVRDYIRDHEKTRFHEQCVISGAAEILRSEKTLDSLWYGRLQRYGWTLKEFREEFLND